MKSTPFAAITESFFHRHCLKTFAFGCEMFQLLTDLRRQEAAPKASKGAARAEGFEVDLQEAQGAWLTPSTLLLALAVGEMVLLNLEVTAGTVSRMKMQRANDIPKASCCCRLGAAFVFLGSWVGDSLLLHVASTSQKVGNMWAPLCRSPFLSCILTY